MDKDLKDLAMKTKCGSNSLQKTAAFSGLNIHLRQYLICPGLEDRYSTLPSGFFTQSSNNLYREKLKYNNNNNSSSDIETKKKKKRE